MANYSDYSSAMDEIARKAYAGDYGDSPFDRETLGGTLLYSDAFTQIGVHDLDSWLGDSSQDTGGCIMDNIRARYDQYIISNDVDNPVAAAFEIEAREQAVLENAPPPKTLDDVILGADDKQQQVDLLVARNEAKIADNKPITTLTAETMQSLRESGVDVGALEKQFGITSNADSSTAESKDLREILATLALPDEPSEKFGLPNYGDTNSVVAEPIQVPVSTEEPESVQNSDVSSNNSGETSSLVAASENDLTVTLDSGETVSFRDILAEICDDDKVKSILAEAVAIVDRGEDPRSFMADAIADYEARHTAGGDVDHEANDGVSSDGHGDAASIGENADSDNGKSKYEANFEKHSEKLDEIKSKPVQIRGDFFKAYHEMARVYNANKGGIEIEGKVPTKVDVTVAVLNFARSNIIETLVIDAIRALVEKKEENKDNVENAGIEKEAPPVDKYGIQENGNIERQISPEEAKEIGNYRAVLPEAGKMFGADMTKADRGSTPDVIVRSTNPDGVNGRGVSVTMDDAKKYAFPDVRLVEIKGERVLVDPFGRVLDPIDSDKYKAGQTLSGLDVSARGAGREALETYAKDKGISVAQAKDAISHDVKERFCDRIESDVIKKEAVVIEKMVIPRELDVRSDLESKLANLDNIEKGATTLEAKAEIAEMKADVSKAIETLNGRIDTLRDRQTDLEQSSMKPLARSTNERFGDAVASEKRAVGRSVFTTDLGIDQKKIQDRVDAGVEAIKAKVEAHNATVPEMDRISYDSKTGDFVDRFGITDKGEYVGNANGKFMEEGVTGPATKEDVAKYIEAHNDPSRFADTDKILASAEIENPAPDVEKPEGFDIEQAEPVDVELTENANPEASTDADSNNQDNAEGRDTERNENENDPADASRVDADATKDSETDTRQSDAANDEEHTNDSATNGGVENPEESGDAIDTSEGDNAVDDAEEANCDTPEQIEGSSSNDAEVKDGAEVDAEANSENATAENTNEIEGAENATDETIEENNEDVDTPSDEQNDSTTAAEASEEHNDVDSDDNSLSGADTGPESNASLRDDEDAVDDLDDVDASEISTAGNATDENTNADIESIDAKNAVEGNEGAETSNDDHVDVIPEDDARKEDNDNEDGEQSSWLDDFKNSLDDYIDGCMKQIDDPIGWQADKIDADIDKICDLIDLLGGDASGLREAAHELVSSAVDAIMNIDDPTSKEAMSEAISNLFEELGIKLEDPEGFFEPLQTEYNDSIGTESEELVDNLTDAYCEGANSREDLYADDTDFDSVHLDDDTLATNDGVVDKLGNETGGITDANASDIEDAINDATADNVPQEVEQLKNNDGAATVEDVDTPIDTEVIDQFDGEATLPDDIPDVELTDTGVDLGGSGEVLSSGAEIAEAAEGLEGLEVLAALL